MSALLKGAIGFALLWCPVGFSDTVLTTSEKLEGLYKYDGFFHENHRFENPNPNLHLYFTFLPNGQHRLEWFRDEDGERCERTGPYSLESGMLSMQTTWLHPRNHPNCAKDPDMQPNRESMNPVERKGDELWLRLELDGKPFFYILKRI